METYWTWFVLIGKEWLTLPPGFSWHLSPDKHPLLLIPRGSGPFDLKNSNSPSSPLSLCPFSCAAISIGVRHASTSWLIWLSLSSLCLSLSFCVVLPIPYHLSFIFKSLLTLLLPLLLHVLIPTGSLYLSMLMFATSTQFNHVLLWWFSSLSSSHLYLTFLTSSHTLTPPQHVIFPLHVTLSALIGHLLYNSSHSSHRSLNGLSPTTISPRSHSSFPSPLSLSR